MKENKEEGRIRRRRSKISMGIRKRWRRRRRRKGGRNRRASVKKNE